MPLVMSFTRLHRQGHWLQLRQLTLLQVQTQSYSSRPTHGLLLLARLKFNTWLLAEAVAVREPLLPMSVAAAVVQEVI
jgi:hypothetical protein